MRSPSFNGWSDSIPVDARRGRCARSGPCWAVQFVSDPPVGRSFAPPRASTFSPLSEIVMLWREPGPNLSRRVRDRFSGQVLRFPRAIVRFTDLELAGGERIFAVLEIRAQRFGHERCDADVRCHGGCNPPVPYGCRRSSMSHPIELTHHATRQPVLECSTQFQPVGKMMRIAQTSCASSRSVIEKRRTIKLLAAGRIRGKLTLI